METFFKDFQVPVATLLIEFIFQHKQQQSGYDFIQKQPTGHCKVLQKLANSTCTIWKWQLQLAGQGMQTTKPLIINMILM